MKKAVTANKQKTDTFGIAQIIIGLFFLVNPNIIVIDIIPDFIGYAFILFGMRRFAKLNITLEESMSAFRALLIVSICRLPAILLYFTFGSGSGEFWGLLFAGALGFFEIFYSSKAFGNFFDGLVVMADSDERIHANHPIYKKVAEVKWVTVIFMVAKAILCLLPELTNISSTEYGTVTNTGIQSISTYRLLFTVVAAVVVLIIGIYWMFVALKYLLPLKKDEGLIKLLCENYESTISDKKEYLNRKNILFALSVFALGTVLSIEFKGEGYNVIPHPIFASVMLAAFAMLKNRYFSAAKAFKTSIIYIVTSLAAWIYTFVFVYSSFADYLYNNTEGAEFTYATVLEVKMSRSFDIIYGWIGTVIAGAIDAAVFILLLILIKKLFEEITRDILGECQTVLKSVKFIFIAGCVSAVSGVVQTFLAAFLPAYWGIDLIIRICWIVSVIIFVSRFKDEMYEIYGDKYK